MFHSLETIYLIKQNNFREVEWQKRAKRGKFHAATFFNGSKIFLTAY